VLGSPSPATRWSKTGNIAVSVLPLPVGAITSVFSPADSGGIASRCGAVGCEKPRSESAPRTVAPEVRKRRDIPVSHRNALQGRTADKDHVSGQLLPIDAVGFSSLSPHYRFAFGSIRSSGTASTARLRTSSGTVSAARHRTSSTVEIDSLSPEAATRRTRTRGSRRR